MGHGVRWGRDHQIKHRTSTIYRTLSARMARPPSPDGASTRGRMRMRSGRRLPHLRPPNRCQQPKKASPPSPPGRSRHSATRRACGGHRRERSQPRSGEDQEKRRARARKGLRAGWRRQGPRAYWRRQGTAAHPASTSRKVVQFLLLVI